MLLAQKIQQSYFLLSFLLVNDGAEWKVCVGVGACACVLPVLVGEEFEEAPQLLRHTSIALHQGQGGE